MTLSPSRSRDRSTRRTCEQSRVEEAGGECMGDMNIEIEVTQRLQVHMTKAAWDTLSEFPMPQRIPLVLGLVQGKSTLVNVSSAHVGEWEVAELYNDGTMAEPVAWGTGDIDETTEDEA